MILLICLIAIVYNIGVLCEEHDAEVRRENDFSVSERRHREIMKQMESKPRKPKITRRRIVKDKEGNIIGEEVIVEE